MGSLKRILRNAVNMYSSLSGLCFVRNTLEFCLSACGLLLCLLSGLRSGAVMLNKAGAADWGEYHQHCSSRGCPPSDKSLTQPSGSDTLATCPLTWKNAVSRESRRQYPVSHPVVPWGLLKPLVGRVSKEGEGYDKKDNLSKNSHYSMVFLITKIIFDLNKSKRWHDHVKIHCW